MDLSRTNLDEDIMSPNNLQCIVDHKNMKLESHGYKIGTSSIDYYKPKQIGMIRSLFKRWKTVDFDSGFQNNTEKHAIDPSGTYRCCRK